MLTSLIIIYNIVWIDHGYDIYCNISKTKATREWSHPLPLMQAWPMVGQQNPRVIEKMGKPSVRRRSTANFYGF